MISKKIKLKGGIMLSKDKLKYNLKQIILNPVNGNFFPPLMKLHESLKIEFYTQKEPVFENILGNVFFDKKMKSFKKEREKKLAYDPNKMLSNNELEKWQKLREKENDSYYKAKLFIKFLYKDYFISDSCSIDPEYELFLLIASNKFKLWLSTL